MVRTKKPNPYAKALADPKYKPRRTKTKQEIEEQKSGRKAKHKKGT